jgi:hypothetical protein
MPLAKSATQPNVAQKILDNPPPIGGHIPSVLVERLPDRYYDYLNVKWDGELELDTKSCNQVNAIWHYAKDRVQSKDDSSIMCYIDRLSHRLGNSPAGEKQYRKIYHYITLDKMSKSMEKEKKMYERKR